MPTIEVGDKESVNDCVAESVILNKYRQHGTIWYWHIVVTGVYGVMYTYVPMCF
jgi:hypothetical protein